MNSPAGNGRAVFVVKRRSGAYCHADIGCYRALFFIKLVDIPYLSLNFCFLDSVTGSLVMD